MLRGHLCVGYAIAASEIGKIIWPYFRKHLKCIAVGVVRLHCILSTITSRSLSSWARPTLHTCIGRHESAPHASNTRVMLQNSLIYPDQCYEGSCWRPTAVYTQFPSSCLPFPSVSAPPPLLPFRLRPPPPLPFSPSPSFSHHHPCPSPSVSHPPPMQVWPMSLPSSSTASGYTTSPQALNPTGTASPAVAPACCCSQPLLQRHYASWCRCSS